MLLKSKKIARDWLFVILTVPAITGIIIALRLFGLLQPLEWAALDTLFQLRPLEPPDERILIVAIEEKDIQKLGQWPISDRVLATLLKKIKQQKPRVIGLDIFRDLQVEPGHQELVEVFKSTPNLIGIEKVLGSSSSTKIPPPLVLKQLDQVSSSDFIVDGDAVIRRAVLYPDLTTDKPIPSLGLALAFKYLKKHAIKPRVTNNDLLRLKQTVFVKFKPNDGGYNRADANGYQILLNYRSPSGNFYEVSVEDVLENRVSPDLMKDRIVLIGSRATSGRDIFYTPIARTLNNSPLPTFGVEIHANVVSQIISSVLDNRPLIQVTSEPIEYILIGVSAGIIPSLILTTFWLIKSKVKFSSGVLLTLFTGGTLILGGILLGGSYLAFLAGWWVPIIPPLLALSSSALININYTIFWLTKKDLRAKSQENSFLSNQLTKYFRTFEARLTKRTQELNNKNEQLKKSLQQLEVERKQIINQAELASLGTLVSGFAKEIREPVNHVIMSSQISMNLANELPEFVFEGQYLDSKSIEDINNILTKIAENIEITKNQGEKINRIIESASQLVSLDSSPKPADIRILIQDSVDLISENFNDIPCIDLQFDPSIEPFQIFIEDCKRVFVNIIGIALHAGFESKKMLGSDFISEVIISTRNLGDSIQVTIQHDDPGVPEYILDETFEPFFLGNSLQEGSGLSLVIACKLITLKLEGKISVEIESGEYIKFIIILPKRIT